MVQQTDPQSTASRNSDTPRRVLIVGGVAGGASCAAERAGADIGGASYPRSRGPVRGLARRGIPWTRGSFWLCVAPGGEPRAQQHEHEPAHGNQAEVLSEHGDTQQHGDHPSHRQHPV